MKTRRNVRLGLLAFLCLFAGSGHAQDYALFDTLEGMWRDASGDSSGCALEAEDTRIKIGRFAYDADSGEYLFGTATDRAIAIYESSCVVADPVQVGSVLTFNASCEQEGAALEGLGRIEVTSTSEIGLSLPFSSEPMVLEKCDVQIAESVAPTEATRRGTAFRGVALGDSRRDVESALDAIALRCLTPNEIDLFKANPMGMFDTGEDVCRLVPRAANLVGNEAQAAAHFNAVTFKEAMLLSYIYAIVFNEAGRASQLFLLPEFFNANGMTAQAFAQSIVDNYPLPEGMTPATNGWSGISASGEWMGVFFTQNPPVTLFMVRWADRTNTPTFN